MSTSTNSHRLGLLSAEEIQDIYGLPSFTDEDREAHFELTPAEQAAVQARQTAVGIFLVLELGYFKAKQRFFSFEPSEVMQDLGHLISRYFPA